MSSAVVVDDPILWSEGMLLTPQHFQQQDLRIQRLLRHQMEQQDPYYYGVVRLAYSTARLDTGHLQIDELHAVLPDGLVVLVGVARSPEKEPPLTLDLSDDPTLAAKRPVLVYLSVPVHTDGAASDRALARRYDSGAGRAAVDDNTGTDPLVVLRLRPRVTLVAGNAPPPGCVNLPLLEVQREVSGQLVVTEYHPPLLELGASEFLGAKSLQTVLAKLVDRVRRRATRLAAMKGNRSQNLFALTAALPELEVLVFSKRARPFEVYRALASMVGSVSALHPDGMPPMLKRYQHEDAYPAFEVAIGYVNDLVRALELEYELYAFEQNEPGAFTLFIEPDWATDELIVELEPAAGTDPAALDAFMTEARVGSADRYAWLAQQRSPGAFSERLSAAAAARYTQRAGVHFFSLKNRTLSAGTEQHEVIEAGQPLLIQGGGRVEPPERIVLYRRRYDSKPGARAQ